ncbi:MULTISPECIES: hypothetical protein [unclassified Mesorhizobium]|uniref:hypothetical protein n=1 Tax=unclassified Mesorhizobium TaxID=325217 RepID=UPI001FEE5EED|nr:MULTISPECIES: hypothetical protein [unclassified Mesorhizobium]
MESKADMVSLSNTASSARGATWAMGALERGKHLMPWRIEDELKAIGANYIQAGRGAALPCATAI